jgi:hypothetical protein
MPGRLGERFSQGNRVIELGTIRHKSLTYLRLLLAIRRLFISAKAGSDALRLSNNRSAAKPSRRVGPPTQTGPAPVIAAEENPALVGERWFGGAISPPNKWGAPTHIGLRAAWSQLA